MFSTVVEVNAVWADLYVFFLIVNTAWFSAVLAVLFVRGFETDFLLRVENKFFSSHRLPLSGFNRLHFFVSPKCRNGKHERRVDMVKCVYRRLRKSLKTNTRILFFVNIFAADVKILLTFDELVKIVSNTVEEQQNIVLYKIVQGYNYEQIMKTDGIPLTWSDRLYDDEGRSCFLQTDDNYAQNKVVTV